MCSSGARLRIRSLSKRKPSREFSNTSAGHASKRSWRSSSVFERKPATCFALPMSIPTYKDSFRSMGTALRSACCTSRFAIAHRSFLGDRQPTELNRAVGWRCPSPWKCRSHRLPRGSLRSPQTYQGFSAPPPLRVKGSVPTMSKGVCELMSWECDSQVTSPSTRVPRKRQESKRAEGGKNGRWAGPSPACGGPSPPGHPVVDGWRRDERTRDIPQSLPRSLVSSAKPTTGIQVVRPVAPPTASTRSLLMPTEQGLSTPGYHGSRLSTTDHVAPTYVWPPSVFAAPTASRRRSFMR